MSTMSDSLKISTDIDLPPSFYDGSHLPWQSYRQHVLGPYRIRVLDSLPKECFPSTLLEMIEADMLNAANFDELSQTFREQVAMGRGFGPSPLFPPNLLPPRYDEPRLARCMIPYFSREALPERALNQMGPFYELNIPRSGLGCGFSSSALTTEELNILPSSLVTTGTIVHFDTGYISPGAAVYCPFLVFERAHAGDREQRLEVATNQCATGGACCVRALQMLYTKAWKGQMMPEMPISFSCVIENSFAVMNLHWIDHGQAYCMAPLCKFDLTKDEHFNQFLVWVDSIGKWALRHLLPLVQRALERLRTKENTPPPTPKAPRLIVDTAGCPNDALIKSLKTTFESIPWRFEDDELTPVSSSTASWGSPMVNDTSFTYYPAVPRQARRTPTSAVQRKQYLAQVGQHPTPPPAYAHSPELVWQRRFAHAMDEIRDLQSQLQTLRTDLTGSNLSFQSELSGIKTTVHSVLRKETLTLRNRSISLGVQEMWSNQNVSRSPLVNEVRPSISPEKASFYEKGRNNFVPLSPKMFSSGLPSPGLPSPGMPSPGMPSPTFSMYSENNMIVLPPAPPKSASFLKFATAMITGHMIGVFIPNMLLRVFVLGCITDVCMLAFASPHLPSSADYLLSFWRSSR